MTKPIVHHNPYYELLRAERVVEFNQRKARGEVKQDMLRGGDFRGLDLRELDASGLDLRDGIPQSSGWLKESRWSLQDLLDHWKSAGLQWVLSTSVLKDGTLEGPDLEQYRILREALPACSIIASGGVRHRADLMALGALQIEAAVAGRALLDGLFKTDGLWR